MPLTVRKGRLVVNYQAGFDTRLSISKSETRRRPAHAVHVDVPFKEANFQKFQELKRLNDMTEIDEVNFDEIDDLLHVARVYGPKFNKIARAYEKWNLTNHLFEPRYPNGDMDDLEIAKELEVVNDLLFLEQHVPNFTAATYLGSSSNWRRKAIQRATERVLRISPVPGRTFSS